MDDDVTRHGQAGPPPPPPAPHSDAPPPPPPPGPAARPPAPPPGPVAAPPPGPVAPPVVGPPVVGPPAVAPPVVGPPVVGAAATGPYGAAPPDPDAPQPRRKRHGCLISLGILFVLLLLLGAAGYVLIGRYSEPEDLGVHATEADFDSALAKLGVTWPELPAGADPADYERVYLGAQPMDATFTEAELSALMSLRHDPSYWPLSDVQVDITGDDTARMSAMVHYAGRDWPVLVEGTAGFGGSGLSADIASAKVGMVPVPGNVLSAASDALESVVNDRTARIPGLDVATLEVTPEGVHVTGTIFETVEYAPTS